MVAQAQPVRQVQHVEMPTGTLTLTSEAGPFAADSLLGFAARANVKRGFLFLSKALGKHWPVRPALMQRVHGVLAASVPPGLPGPVVFIAMAETAVGLGQGVFEAWLAANPDREGLFIHTSRYRVGNAPLIEFAEAHSHAPRQFLHLPDDPAMRAMLQGARSLVLVDDEASTGNTFLNLVAACRTLSLDVAHVHLCTITNFMGAEATAALSGRFGLPVTMGAALNGSYTFAAGEMAEAAPAQRFDPDAERGASPCFGRMGLRSALADPSALAERLAAQVGACERVLVLGTGEFMHPSFMLGRALEQRGVDVMVQSTTRSPILTWGAVGHALSFPDNYGEGIANFIYNVAPGQYEHVFICHETPAGDALHQLARSLHARLFHFQSETRIEEIPVC
ncbi:hypothetical protein C7C56_003565 [Massilia glaciei]|uniref:TRSP domain C terminus to PRTase_2 n=2 Tax=Massilia glaciei TaxID=1524097 RepID=A0A2U2I5W4_9BURK|nr:hypothetical protein C7C56_003565 [Massilia glaciei]